MMKPKRIVLFTLIICAILFPLTTTLAGDGDMTLSGDLGVGGSLTVGSVIINPPPKNILRVSNDGGGDYTTINAALSSITDNDIDNHYLIAVAPGRYNEKITMKPYVDIEGSGINQTWIESDGGSTATNSATVVGCKDAELRSLTVGSYAFWAEPDNAYALGILHNSDGLFLMTDIEISAQSASGGDCTGIYIQNGQYYINADRVRITSNCGDTAISYGIFTAGSIRLNSSKIRAVSTGNKTSTAIKSIGTTVTHDKTEVWNSEIIAYHSGGGAGIAKGIENTNGDVTVRYSVVDANELDPDSAAIYNDGGDTYLATSQIKGTIKKISGTLKCIHLYNGYFNALSCP